MGSLPPTKKRIQLNFFEYACTGSHMCPGQWRNPNDKGYTKDRLPYWIELAKLAERGKISCIFFADSYGEQDVFGGNSDNQLRAGNQTASLDPLVIIPAMAAATKSVGFGVTGSTTYIKPYALARTLSSLDHLTEGRIAWNIVTSYAKSAASALGVTEGVVAHDQRYAMADEYMDICYKLWQSSWSDDAVRWDREKGVAFDPAKVKKIDHNGKFLTSKTRFQTHPSPQGTPTLFQAGASKAGRSFAAKHAEAIYIGGLVPSQSAATVAETRAAAAANGRDPKSLKFFVGISPIVGRTLEEAQEKYRVARQYADVVGGLAVFSGYTGVDLSGYPLDEPFTLDGKKPTDNAIHSFLNMFNQRGDDDEEWTPRRLGEVMALGGFHPAPVGTPSMVAAVFEQWIDEADVDGFNISATVTAASLEDVVDLLRPELVRRGLMWEDYDVPGGTLRENMAGVQDQKNLPAGHYGSRFVWGSGYQGESMDAKGEHSVE